MSQEPANLQAIIRRNLSDKPALRTEDGLSALTQLAALAQQQQIRFALAGGLAMHLYGFNRATTNVDVLASGLLDLASERKLSFGGASYVVQLGELQVVVDWIVREDFFRNFYERALAEAVDSGIGHPILTPEWLVILKYLAGRSKDQLDLLWLLRAPGLVDRQRVQQLMIAVMGEFAAHLPLRELERLFLEADQLRMRDETDEGTL